MVQINFALKEISCKIVYYGPGLSGKTTNIEQVHAKAPDSNRGNLTSIATEGDRTLFFDFLPLDLGSVGGMRTKFQLYTVPGQVFYNATRKLVLAGVDGVIFVADSDPEKMQENLESIKNLEENLNSYGISIDELPVVIQFNKRDLPNAVAVDVMNKELNPRGWPHFEATAVSGDGVFPTLKALSQTMLENLNKKRAARQPGLTELSTPVSVPTEEAVASTLSEDDATMATTLPGEDATGASEQLVESAPATIASAAPAAEDHTSTSDSPTRVRRVTRPPLPKAHEEPVRRAVTRRDWKKKKSNTGFWVMVAVFGALILGLVVYIMMKSG